MKFLKILSCFLSALLALTGASRAYGNNAGAVVLVNSQSAKFQDYNHFLRPYLTNFGVPFDLLDIASNPVGTNLTNYALIIVGHAQLDTNHLYLNATAQSNLCLAVSNGTGFVSFDNVLATNNTALYQFEQNLFGLGYTTSTTSGSVAFPATEPGTKMHYLTSLHPTNDTLSLAFVTDVSTIPTTITVPGLIPPTNVTSVATCGGKPFVLITKYGQGHAVQWASYDWMSSAVQGPVNGLDDLVWRGFVWAARKPFVMRSLPNFVTMRIDDVMGYQPTPGITNPPLPLWWVHDMTNAGFKPFLSLFISDIDDQERNNNDGRKADLRALVTSGNATASIHAFRASPDTNFFYFNHHTLTQWPDDIMSNNYVAGTQWLQANGIPSSSVIVAHYAEMGTNSFNGLTNLGVQFVLINVVPGTVQYVVNPGAPWLVGGPYRLFETPQPGRVNMPTVYADWLVVPNHPELNGKFFNCCVEIRNAGPAGEWAPADNDIPGSIARGYNTLKRGFDSLTLATLFTHEFYIQHIDGPQFTPITTNHWQTILQGITNNLAPYRPIYVTLDYACRYIRATHTTQILSGDFDPVTGRLSATFSGYTDLPITACCFTGEDAGITNLVGSVPAFTNSLDATLGSLPVPALLLNPVVTNLNLTFTLQGQYGHAYGIDKSPDLSNWSQIQTATLTNGTAFVTQPVGTSNLYFRARLLP